MAHTYKQLGQSRPSSTTAVSLYSPATSTTAIIKTIVICNTSGASAKYRLFHDDDGTTYDETTAFAWDDEIDPAIDSKVPVEINICANGSSGNLAVRTDTADALTFTAYGLEIT